MYNMGLENETELENIQNIQNIDTILNNMLDDMVDLNETSNLNETSLNNSLLMGHILNSLDDSGTKPNENGDKTNNVTPLSVESYEINREPIDFKRQNYTETEKEVNKFYYDEFDYYSSSLDILASYLKGQKIIYMEAKSFCQR